MSRWFVASPILGSVLHEAVVGHPKVKAHHLARKLAVPRLGGECQILMVMQTLNCLSKLDYPNFEVIVLDNNTSDESLWRPVAAHFAFRSAYAFMPASLPGL